jgi:non-ribosomal peptide synthetase component F
MSFNLAVILTETARSTPDHPVAVFDGGRLTYRELDQASDRVAAALVVAGIEPGDRVALQLQPHVRRPGLEHELVSYCRERMAAYKCPRIFQFRSEGSRDRCWSTASTPAGCSACRWPRPRAPWWQVTTAA